MGTKGAFEATPLRQLQRYHHSTLNSFGDGETLVEAIHRRPGVYGPNPIAYLSLMARRPTLTLGDLDEALINDRSLVRATAFRGSLFLVPSEDYPLYFRALYETLSSSGMSRLRSEGIDEAQMLMYADRLRAEAFTMPRTEAELSAALFPGKEKRPSLDVERTLLRKLCDIGVLIRTTTKGWKGNQFSYALAMHWLEGVDLTPENQEQAKVEVVRRYLRAYGPSRFEDVVWWTGLSSADIRRVLETLGREAVKFLVDGLGEGLVALRETAEQIRKGGAQTGVPDRILFLPLWDAYPLGWRDRTRVVEPRFAPWVYDPAGNTTSVILEEGRVIGLWQFRDGDFITLEFHIFEPYANRLNAVRLAAETHAGQLAVVAGARDLRVIERSLPAALAERPAASFLWPLGKEPVFRVSESEYLGDNPMDRRAPVNVLRSKYLDDERLVRPAEDEGPAHRPLSLANRGQSAVAAAIGESKHVAGAADGHKPALRIAETPPAKAQEKPAKAAPASGSSASPKAPGPTSAAKPAKAAAPSGSGPSPKAPGPAAKKPAPAEKAKAAPAKKPAPAEKARAAAKKPAPAAAKKPAPMKKPAGKKAR